MYAPPILEQIISLMELEKESFLSVAKMRYGIQQPEDIYQQTALRLIFASTHQRLPSSVANLGKYVRAVFNNECKSYVLLHYRHRIRVETDMRNGHGKDYSFLGNIASFPLPTVALERRELWDRLRFHLSHLPQKRAHAFSATYMEGRARKEIAASCGISRSTLNCHLHRARYDLRKLLEQDGFAPPF